MMGHFSDIVNFFVRETLNAPTAQSQYKKHYVLVGPKQIHQRHFDKVSPTTKIITLISPKSNLPHLFL